MNRASIFMAATWTGLAGMIALAAALMADAGDGLRLSAAAMLIVSSFALLFTRRSDEYTRGLWNAGASVAFGAMLILSIGLGFAEGLVDGLTDSTRERTVSADTVLTLEIAAFYIGLFVKRLLGDA